MSVCLSETSRGHTEAMCRRHKLDSLSLSKESRHRQNKTPTGFHTQDMFPLSMQCGMPCDGHYERHKNDKERGGALSSMCEALGLIPNMGRGDREKKKFYLALGGFPPEQT